MSKEKEMLRVILANTNSIMEHLKIKGTVSPEKQSDKTSKHSEKATKTSKSLQNKSASAKKGK